MVYYADKNTTENKIEKANLCFYKTKNYLIGGYIALEASVASIVVAGFGFFNENNRLFWGGTILSILSSLLCLNFSKKARSSLNEARNKPNKLEQNLLN